MQSAEPASPSPALAGVTLPRRPLSFFRFVRAIGRNAIAGYDQSLYEQSLVPVRWLGRNHFILNDPAGIRRVLVDNAANYVKGDMEHRVAGLGLSGDEAQQLDATWQARRRILAPLFDYRIYPEYASVVSQAVLRRMDAWAARSANEPLEISAAMLDLASEVIAAILFSFQHEEIAEPLRAISAMRLAEPLLDLVDFVPGVNRRRRAQRGRAAQQASRQLAAHLDRIVQGRIAEGRIVEDRIAGHGIRNRRGGDRDLLDRLISGSSPAQRDETFRREIRSILITMFSAGHESVAQALTWTWYLLSQHPEQERTLHSELDSVLAGRAPQSADLDKLVYTRMVLEESMRLYPPFPLLAWREALAGDELCGTAIAKGATVSIVPWLLHRHRALWPNADSFSPERFSPEPSAARPRFAYLPFGAGPRVCLGAVFAMMEATLILAAIAQRFRLRLLAGHRVEPHAGLILRPRFGMQMILEPRAGVR